MRLAEPTAPGREPTATGPGPRRRQVSLAGWGGGDRVPAEVVTPAGVEDLRAALAGASRGVPAARRGAIPRGMGRSYGDAAQLRDGLVLDATGLRGFELDPASGTVTAGAGVTLGELLGVLPASGWVVPVLPGTQHVSVGGAIASDIHGKNHGAAGTFGRHVEALGLLTADGELRELSPQNEGELFAATLGGMGLTGTIVWARIKLAELPSTALSVDTDRVGRLDDALAALEAPGGTHRVAWLDLLSPRPVRGVITRAEPLAEPAPGSVDARCTVPARLTVPRGWPGGILRPGIVRAYNDYRYRTSPRQEVGRVEAFGPHMFPLDVLDRWPRLYGRAGFVQYQLAVPRGSEPALEAVIERLRRSTVPCYLAVLKDFGAANEAPLSFPIEGWTLTLDLPRSAPGLEPLMSRFDQLVAEAGGRVYLAKDARLRPEMLEAMYPRLQEWRAARDAADPERVWRSDLGLRTGLIGAER
jgi:decaprenylphospho-beta-D-ribofuranose 2-oxidase